MEDLLEKTHVAFKNGLAQRSDLILRHLADLEALYLFNSAYKDTKLKKQLYLLAGACIKWSLLESPGESFCFDFLSGKTMSDKKGIEKIILEDDYSQDLSNLQFTRTTKTLLRELNMIASSEKLKPYQITLIADFATRLLGVFILEKEGHSPFISLTYKIQQPILDALLALSFKLGDSCNFARTMSQVCNEDLDLPNIDPNKTQLNSSELEKRVMKRRKKANLLIDLAIRRYFQNREDDEKLQRRIIHLIHLTSGFLNGEDIRKTIDPSLPQANHTYSISEIQSTLHFLEKLITSGHIRT